MKLFPFKDCIEQADARIKFTGATAYQQFNCAKCGVKQTMDIPNTFYRTGKCEGCGHVTDIEKDGCNYMLILGKVPHE